MMKEEQKGKPYVVYGIPRALGTKLGAPILCREVASFREVLLDCPLVSPILECTLLEVPIRIKSLQQQGQKT